MANLVVSHLRKNRRFYPFLPILLAQIRHLCGSAANLTVHTNQSNSTYAHNAICSSPLLKLVLTTNVAAAATK